MPVMSTWQTGDSDAVLDAWIFAARLPAIDCVWRYGRKVVSGGRHVDHERISARYRASMTSMLTDGTMWPTKLR